MENKEWKYWRGDKVYLNQNTSLEPSWEWGIVLSVDNNDTVRVYTNSETTVTEFISNLIPTGIQVLITDNNL